MITLHPTLGERSLSDDQVKSLAEMVSQGLKRLDDSDIRVPLTCEYLVEHHWAPHYYYQLPVDVDIGITVLTFRLPILPSGPFLRTDSDLAKLADGIC